MSTSDPEQIRPAYVTWAAAFGVHVFTASGAALALLALMAAAERRWASMFVWLMVALAVDGIDGQFARRYRVKETAPRWSGETLDLVVDILTYVFVPTYALLAADLLPPAVAVPLACAIMITSVLYFADTHMKSRDNYFMGFPGIWNVVIFFLLLWRLPPWIAATLVAIFCVLTFVPVPFLHPLRVQRGRSVNVGLVVVATVLGVLAVVDNLEPGPFVTVPLSLVGIYFLVAGWLQRDTRA
jgi:phosphatidylcholine synthase